MREAAGGVSIEFAREGVVFCGVISFCGVWRMMFIFCFLGEWCVWGGFEEGCLACVWYGMCLKVKFAVRSEIMGLVSFLNSSVSSMMVLIRHV